MNDNLESPIKPRYFTRTELASVVGDVLWFVGAIFIGAWWKLPAWLIAVFEVIAIVNLLVDLANRKVRYELELLKRDTPEEFRRKVRARFKVQD